MEVITISNVITWTLVIVSGAIGWVYSAAVLKVSVERVIKVMFDANGELRIVTFPALERILDNRTVFNNLECNSVKTDLHSIKLDMENLRASLNKHNQADANRYGEVVACITKAAEKLEIVCRGINRED
jgi:hypothetical protein